MSLRVRALERAGMTALHSKRISGWISSMRFAIACLLLSVSLTSAQSLGKRIESLFDGYIKKKKAVLLYQPRGDYTVVVPANTGQADAGKIARSVAELLSGPKGEE